MVSQVTEAVVIDAGSQSTRAGFAGESFPRCIIPTTVGRFRQYGLTEGLQDVYFGQEAIVKRGISKLTSPVKDGLIADWDEMEKFWHHVFYKGLHVAPEESRVMIAVHPLTPRIDKEKIAEILFESFTIHDLYIAISSALVLHASGRTTGVVWENGYSCAYASPVFEGFPLKHATVRSNLNGTFLTDRLQNLLANIGYSFTTPIERTLLERIKAELCFVTLDYENEVTQFSKDNVTFELPDGQRIYVGEERFKCPEVLFEPASQGIDHPSIVDDIFRAIHQCDMDYKSVFFNNVVLSGGSSMFKQLPERLTMELRKRAVDLPEVTVNVDAMPARHSAVWTGGSILATLDSAKGFWMTRKDYEDSGKERVHYKFY